ncbi:MAG: magnesium and cobalt transport protein CorA [Helicobacteraceae bacterium CG2_30_36_10]|nr:MAG: magnesium and cobalt transport protein CorA [Helicobacteraceae bacterium CG2_30_36_10]
MTAKVGLAPGVAVYTGNVEVSTPIARAIVYKSDSVEASDFQSYEQLQEIYNNLDKNSMSWIHIEPISDQESIAKISSIFELHPLVVEDILSVTHRPKTEEFDEYIFIVMKYAKYSKNELTFSQISFVLKENFLISFADETTDRFEIIKKRLEKQGSRIKKESNHYLLSALIDYIVDDYFVILESIGDEIEELEDEILNNPTKKSMESVHRLKRNLMELKKRIWPIRELVNVLIHSDDIDQKYYIYFKDVYEHIINIVDITEGYRDTISSFLDIYLSTLSNRMNEIMKTLSIIGTIFIPLSFLTGYFGMNFKYETLLESQSAYYYSNILMIAVPVSLLTYFKIRKWF